MEGMDRESIAPMSVRHVFLGSVLLALAACGGAPSRLPTKLAPATVAPDSFLVRFETGKGPFDVMVHRAWSPAAAARVYDLVRRRHYDDIRVFRVVPNYVVQFGLTGDSAVDWAWRGQGLPDEPVLQPNTRGRVGFARAGPRTRSTQLFIDLKDNTPRLDTLAVGGVVGYPPFGEVVRGMAVVDSMNAEYGGAPAEQQDSIATLGNAWLDREYPRLDRILSARIVREWGPRRSGSPPAGPAS
jgi:peptidyl-prolyl cis-trans isomerase A (cyclophilin A)